jgi:hypothetical protein
MTSGSRSLKGYIVALQNLYTVLSDLLYTHTVDFTLRIHSHETNAITSKVITIYFTVKKFVSWLGRL